MARSPERRGRQRTEPLGGHCPGSTDAARYVTGASAATVKRIIDHSTVQAMIDAAVAAGSGGAVIVDDIAARNALTPVNAHRLSHRSSGS